MCEKDWLSRTIADDFDDDELTNINSVLDQEHYNGLHVNKEEGETWFFYGRPNYEKPFLSNLYIPIHLVKKPDIQDNQTLDELDVKPVFKVLSEEESKCLPYSARITLKKHGLYNKVTEKNVVEGIKSLNISSSSSSIENLINMNGSSAESSAESQSQPLYKGKPVIYRKCIEKDEDSQKVQNQKRIKKNLKHRKKNVNPFYFEENYDPVNDIVYDSYTTRKKYSLNIHPSSGVDIGVDSEIHKLTPDYYLMRHETETSNATAFPKLVESPETFITLQNTLNPDNISNENSSIWEKENISENDSKFNSDLLVIENIPPSVEHQELDDLLDDYGNCIILKTIKGYDTNTIHFKTDSEVSWVQGCINNQRPFGEKQIEPLKCYIIENEEAK